MPASITAVVFSKDRALQLDGTLASFSLHCRDAAKVRLVVLCKASTARHQAQYARIQAMYPQVPLCQEQNFKDQLLSFLTSERVLFLVDDNIFVRDFYMEDIVKALAVNPDALGCSLRLGKNTTYCYSLNRSQAVPSMTRTLSTSGDSIVSYRWPGTEADFGYPLEVSSSVYRCADILEILRDLPFSNPNSLEGLLSQQAQRFTASKPKLLCYENSLTFCNPINKVQQVAPDNRAGVTVSYSADDLAQIFDRDGRMDVKSYSGYTPNACHEEVELKLRYPAVSMALAEPPLVSVVIPCYKQAHFLRDAVSSVAQQTYSNWECFIVNDGSPDDTSAVAKQLIQEYSNCKFTLIEKENEGLAEARNTGIRESKGEWILPLDSDDKFHPTYMEKAVTVASADYGVNIVSAFLQEFGAKSDVLQVFPYSQQQILQGNMFPYASLYRRSLWEKHGGYIPIIPFGAEDYNFWVTCSLELNPRRIEEPLFFYRKHQGSSMVDAVISHQYEVDACLHTCHVDLYTPEVLLRDHQVLSFMHDDTLAAIGRTIAKFPQYPQPYLWRGLHNLTQGHWRQAERDFKTSTLLCRSDDWQPWFQLTLLYLERKNFAAAQQTSSETIRRCPHFPARKKLEEMVARKGQS